MQETDPSWEDWRLEVFGDPYLVWHDGADFPALFSAYNDSPGEVDRMLAAGVQQRDPLAAHSICRLGPDRPVRQALEALAAADVTSHGEFALRRAQALLRLTGDSTHRQTMAAILNGPDHWGCGSTRQ